LYSRARPLPNGAFRAQARQAACRRPGSSEHAALPCGNRGAAIDRAQTRSYTRRSEPVAQPVEHLTFNQGVVGSSPTGLAKQKQRVIGKPLEDWHWHLSARVTPGVTVHLGVFRGRVVLRCARRGTDADVRKIVQQADHPSRPERRVGRMRPGDSSDDSAARVGQSTGFTSNDSTDRRTRKAAFAWLKWKDAVQAFCIKSGIVAAVLAAIFGFIRSGQMTNPERAHDQTEPRSRRSARRLPTPRSLIADLEQFRQARAHLAEILLSCRWGGPGERRATQAFHSRFRLAVAQG
jgi:hypothetical protein